jgi:hypothetical protein
MVFGAPESRRMHATGGIKSRDDLAQSSPSPFEVSDAILDALRGAVASEPAD